MKHNFCYAHDQCKILLHYIVNNVFSNYLSNYIKLYVSDYYRRDLFYHEIYIFLLELRTFSLMHYVLPAFILFAEHLVHINRSEFSSTIV